MVSNFSIGLEWYEKWGCETVSYTHLLYNQFQKNFNDTFNKLSAISKNKIERYEDIQDELEQLPILSQELEFLKKFETEITKMKKGSIALLNQITTISKQRIYYPKNSKDLLAGVHLSNSSVYLLDKKMIQLFTKWVYFYWL